MSQLEKSKLAAKVERLHGLITRMEAVGAWDFADELRTELVLMALELQRPDRSAS